MPWQETHVVNERVKFVAAAQSGRWTMTELCEQFSVSLETGYKLLQRYESEGIDGLRDRSRAPSTHPNRLSPELEAATLRGTVRINSRRPAVRDGGSTILSAAASQQ
jgi:hypothetical protein